MRTKQTLIAVAQALIVFGPGALQVTLAEPDWYPWRVNNSKEIGAKPYLGCMCAPRLARLVK